MSLFKDPVPYKIWWLLACLYISAFGYYEANSLALLSVVPKAYKVNDTVYIHKSFCYAKLLHFRVLICLVSF